MTEHEKLKWICDTIGYESKLYFNTNNSKKYFEKEIETEVWEGEGTRAYQEEIEVDVKVNVREIIFNPDFMEKLEKYHIDNISGMSYKFEEDMVKMLYKGLQDPVEYLYNLLK